MKPYSLIFLLLLLLLPAAVLPAQGLRQMDEENGFMGYILGQPGDSIKGITDKGKFQKLSVAVPVLEPFDYNGLLLKSVKLYFWKGNLHSLEIKTKGEITAVMQAIIISKYGEGEKLDVFDTQRQWIGNNLILQFEQNLVTKDGSFTWTHHDTHRDYYNTIYKNRYAE